MANKLRFSDALTLRSGTLNPSVRHPTENEKMTLGQRKLIEKTFGVMGHLSLIVAASLVLYGIGWTLSLIHI